MNQAPLIKGQKIILRKPESKDIENRFRLGRVPEIVHMYGGDTRNMQPFTMEDARKWVEFALSNKYAWTIEFEGKCIGTARLIVDEANKRARYAVGIQDISKLAMGFGTEVTELMLDFAFNVLKVHRVELMVLEYNHRAIACYKKCGFIEEGRVREGALIEGRWETDIMMSILEQEYKNKIKK